MLTIPGYQVLAKIYESANCLVYRGRQEHDNIPVILKILKQEYPSPEEINRYKQEYKLTRSLNLSGSVKAYSLQKYQNTLIMILEDLGGESLRQLMASQKLTILGFLNLALKITESLGEIHAANIIHKDINPSNVIFNPVTGQVKIIDFSISTRLTKAEKKSNFTTQHQGLEGTLAYMSPEQTGRMNRSLDYRTDFYSLGVTFYELLAQQLPFQAADAMELVHAHIAKQPVPPDKINREIPSSVSNIVMKLLAKTAEDRYQSAWGIKADLSACLEQLQSRGYIEEFPLAREDISDKFEIPHKLYGREQEIETLLAAFDRVRRGKTEMMLVLGYSGIGKSALVQEIYQPITQRKGHFIWGKFDQLQRGIPYAAIVSAFTELVRQLLTESEAKLALWRQKILAAFGPNGQIIIDVIPEVELIVGPQPTVADLKPSESQNRFNLVFQNFIRVFCDREHPLVIFLDDLQWADFATLKLIELMMTYEETQYLFLIGSYRDNEVSPTHPLMMTIDRLRDDGTTINEIPLAPLKIEHIAQLIAQTLSKNQESVKPLAELVVRKTQGNPFFVNQFLQTLDQENLLTFNDPQSGKMGGWTWDIAEIEAIGITDNVVELMISKLKKFPESTQQVLRLASCLGNQFDLNTLSLIYEKESFSTFGDMLPAIESGLIQPSSQAEAEGIALMNYPLLILNYKFLHDRVQQAAYALIDESQKQAVHLKIGRLLLAMTPVEYRADRIFDLVDHLNIGRSLIEPEGERVELANLNLDAAKKAKDATAYVAAYSYVTAGMDLLREDIWESDYDLAFALHKERAEIEYLNGNFSESEEFINLILSRAKSVTEKIEVYNLLLVQYNLRAKYSEAVQAGKEALRLLEIELPTEDLPGAISAEVALAKENLGDREIAELMDVPEITAWQPLATVKLLNNLAPSVYMLDPQLWTVLVLKGSNICIKSGYAPESSFFYPTYGMLLAVMFGDYKSAYEFGVLGLKLNQKWGQPVYKASATLVVGLNYWLNHLKEGNEIANEGYQSALDSGDLQYGGYMLLNKLLNLYMQGYDCVKLLSEAPKYLQFSKKTENSLVTDTLTGLHLVLLNLNNKTPTLWDFQSETVGEAEYIENCQQHQNFYSLGIYQIFKLQVLYLYGNIDEALKCALATEGLMQYLLGILPVTEYNFYSSLVLAAAYPSATAESQKQYAEKLEANQQQLKIWADNCPANFQHKYLMVASVMARISGRDLESLELIDRAIASARESEFPQNEALGNELAAKFWLSKGKEKYAKLHLIEAYYGYQRWGAVRKLSELETQYPQLLTKTTRDTGDVYSLTTTIRASGEQSTGALDLATVVKAGQAISGEIVLDKLLASLMEILIENAGAQQGFLILPESGELLIAASASVDGEEVIVQQSTLVESSQDLPVTVIKYVERSHKDVVLSNAARSGQFTTDPYIAAKKLKSLLCMPILNQGKLIGILYLENNLTVGAFTPARLKVLRLLSSQAAISLENALLYANLEQKVAERTQELNEKNESLSETLEELKRTQTQLIQTEKMSGLGQMVAGVAHEINNPISFIYGNVDHASDYIQDLLNLIDLYQEHYPEPVEEIQEEIEDLDLEFLTEDLQKLLKSMKVGAERIRNIVLSLRSFSGLHETGMKPTDINESIDSTLLIVQSRLKGSGQKASIEVVKEYGQLPKVTCFANQLNQVFMNIFGNGIDALESARGQQNSSEPPTITIRTKVTESNSVQIQIADNGPGMPPKVLQKIFDPFFTTKPVGSGTGLGLSVSYQIVVDKHGGQLSCVSPPGKGATFTIEIPIKPKK
ncbi:MAG: AAA family ATPase [Hormoscilla sp.]